MSDWKEIPLGELYEIRSGLSKPKSDFGHGYPFLAFKDVFYNTFVPENLVQLVKSTPKERESCSIKRGDVFLTRTSETQDELGMSCVALKDYENATFNGFTKRLRPKPGTKIFPEYSGYFFRSPKFRQKITAMSSLSTRASLNNEMIERLIVTLPPESEQIAISHILKVLDDKIELNRRMNETLEAMARAIFKDWFVDFGPTRAKMSGRAAYLPEHIWSLFPEAIDPETDLPMGWEFSTIGEEVKVLGGATPSTKEADFWDGGIAWATPKDLSNLNTPVLLETARTISKNGLAKISSGLLPVGTVLLSSRAPVGYLAISEIPIAVNQGFIAMVCKGRLSNIFVLLWAKENMDVIIQNANGSTFQEVSKRNFRPINVVVGGSQVLYTFDEKIHPLYQRIVDNEIESRTLADLRDRLLPKLMSGEIRVKTAEKMIEEVL
jgi:type I restriction enzyme S subunit